ncbi:hypothetical protein LAV84_30335, partial [Rhizobium sp. VS19-DR104.2]
SQSGRSRQSPPQIAAISGLVQSKNQIYAKVVLVSALCLLQPENDLVAKCLEQHPWRLVRCDGDVDSVAFTDFTRDLQCLIKAVDRPFCECLIALLSGKLIERKTPRAMLAQTDMGHTHDKGIVGTFNIRTHFSMVVLDEAFGKSDRNLVMTGN